MEDWQGDLEQQSSPSNKRKVNGMNAPIFIVIVSVCLTDCFLYALSGVMRFDKWQYLLPLGGFWAFYDFIHSKVEKSKTITKQDVDALSERIRKLEK